MSWIDWYFERANREPSPRLKDLLFREVRPGCSMKQLEVIGKAVLDKDRPAEVDWTRIRSLHLYLKRDKLSERAILSAVGNMQRLASKGLIRRVNEWWRKESGYAKKQRMGTPTELLDEDAFLQSLEEVVAGQPRDVALGIRLGLLMAYYCGIKGSLVSTLVREDFLYLNGRTLVYSQGLLLELPPQVDDALKALLATQDRRRSPRSRIFIPEVARALRAYTTIHHTAVTLRKMRA